MMKFLVPLVPVVVVVVTLSSTIATATASMATSTTGNRGGGIELRSNSPAGRVLLSKATLLNSNNDEGEGSQQQQQRQLADNNNYYTSWMTEYSIKWVGCHSIPQFEREEGMRSMLLAKFKMCPSDNCNKCPNAGEYIVNMRYVLCTLLCLVCLVY